MGEKKRPNATLVNKKGDKKWEREIDKEGGRG